MCVQSRELTPRAKQLPSLRSGVQTGPRVQPPLDGDSRGSRAQSPPADPSLDGDSFAAAPAVTRHAQSRPPDRETPPDAPRSLASQEPPTPFRWRGAALAPHDRDSRSSEVVPSGRETKDRAPTKPLRSRDTLAPNARKPSAWPSLAFVTLLICWRPREGSV